jgi:hypothetical protein
LNCHLQAFISVAALWLSRGTRDAYGAHEFRRALNLSALFATDDAMPGMIVTIAKIERPKEVWRLYRPANSIEGELKAATSRQAIILIELNAVNSLAERNARGSQTACVQESSFSKLRRMNCVGGLRNHPRSLDAAVKR